MGQSASHPKDTGAGMDMGHCGSMGPCMGMDQGTVAIPAGVLRITFGDKSAEWTPATLAALPHKTVTVYNEHAKAMKPTPAYRSSTCSLAGRARQAARQGFAAVSGGRGIRWLQGGLLGGRGQSRRAWRHCDCRRRSKRKTPCRRRPPQLVATREKRPARWVRNLVGVRVLTVQ